MGLRIGGMGFRDCGKSGLMKGFWFEGLGARGLGFRGSGVGVVVWVLGLGGGV